VVNLDLLTYAGNPANLDSLKADPRHLLVEGLHLRFQRIAVEECCRGTGGGQQGGGIEAQICAAPRLGDEVRYHAGTSKR
jgi:hypothetical protein